MANKVKTRRRLPRRRDHINVQRDLVHYKLSRISSAIPLEDFPDVAPDEMLKLVINRTVFLWRACCAEVDALKPGVAKNQSEHDKERWASYDEFGNIIIGHNYWIELESKLRAELGKLTEVSMKLGLDERRARVAEGQLQVLGEALKAACVAVGIGPEQQKVLGAALRTELATIEGSLAHASEDAA